MEIIVYILFINKLIYIIGVCVFKNILLMSNLKVLEVFGLGVRGWWFGFGSNSEDGEK